MRPGGTRFLPDRLRPRARQRRPRRWLALAALVPGLLLLAAWWRVGAVEVGDCPALPRAARRSLQELVGTPVLLLDLEWVQERVQGWPGVAAVEVALVPPGTLRVTAATASAAASRPVGRRFHGVAADGSLTGPLTQPRTPLLESFPTRPGELELGLEVARRLERESGAEALAVRRVTPADFEVGLRFGDGSEAVAVHVGPRPTESERFWSRAVRGGLRPAPWTDLRGERRLVTRPAVVPPAGPPTGPDAAGEGPA